MKPAGIVIAVLGTLALIVAALLPGVIVPNVAQGMIDETNSTTYAKADVKYLDQAKLVEAVTANNPELAYATVQLDNTRLTTAVTDNQEAKDLGVGMLNTESVNTIAGTDEESAASPGDSAVFAFDRANSELVTCCGARIGEDTSVDFQGILPLKFPFNAPQADLQVLNPSLQVPATTKFEGTEERYGMTLNKYSQSIPASQLPGEPLLEVPMELAKTVIGVFAPAIAPQLDAMPQDQPVKFYRFTQQENTYLVEPKTGQIVDGSSKATDTARFDGGSEDILLVAEQVGTSGDVEAGAAAIKSDADLINTAGGTLPIILGVLGLLGLGGGAALARKGNKAADGAGVAVGPAKTAN